jgi:transposase
MALTPLSLVRMERPAPDSQLADYGVNRERPAAQSRIRMRAGDGQRTIVGLDVHAESIAVAVAETDGEVRSLGVIPNRAESVGRLIRKLGNPEQLRVCYEAGPTGYVLYWQLSSLGVQCEVVAPTLVPVKAGDRLKTDRRDAQKLARSYRAGDLTPVWVPDAAHEALRDLVRARLAVKRDQLRAPHRLSKFLLRHGRRAPEGSSRWSEKYLQWVKDAGALCLRGTRAHARGLRARDRSCGRAHRSPRAFDRCGDRESAGEDARRDRGAAEPARDRPDQRRLDHGQLGELSRFEHPRQLIGYSGAVSREHSGGERIHRGPMAGCAGSACSKSSSVQRLGRLAAAKQSR